MGDFFTVQIPFIALGNIPFIGGFSIGVVDRESSVVMRENAFVLIF